MFGSDRNNAPTVSSLFGRRTDESRRQPSSGDRPAQPLHTQGGYNTQMGVGYQDPPYGGRPAQSRHLQSGYDTQMGGGYQNTPYSGRPAQPLHEQGGYDNQMGGGYQDAPYGGQQNVPSRMPYPKRQQLGQNGPMQLKPEPTPGGNKHVYDNLVLVSPDDFPSGNSPDPLYLLLNNKYVYTANRLRGWAGGRIGIPKMQRACVGASMMPNETVAVSIFDPSGPNTSELSNLVVEVSFASSHTTDQHFTQDELAKVVTGYFSTQFFAPGQSFLIDYASIPLKLEVKSVEFIDPVLEKAGFSQTVDPTERRGRLFKETKIDFHTDGKSKINLERPKRRPAAKAILKPDFKFEDMGIGGLDNEFSAIFRRAFASRLFPPELVARLDIQHVRGMLLYGPPGTGKTLIARKIGEILNAQKPKIINGPEVLNKYVGQSEENIRKLFADAEKEQKESDDNQVESSLHIIIFDELDAVCKQRGSGAGGGTGVGDSVVNQLLSKLDGVEQLNNILLIGMTNRMDMIDEALLRPGRLEVHVEISLPDERGRQQILKIHTQKMMQNDILDTDVDLPELAKLTKNFSGAEITGLVKAASSFAFTRHIKVGTMAALKDDVEDMKVNRSDFMQALDEVQPLFGVAEEEISKRFSRGIIKFSDDINKLLRKGSLFIDQVRSTTNATSMLSVLVYGPPGAGKTALAAKMAIDSEAPFIKLISPGDMIGFSEMQKVQQFDKIFRDAYKSPLSVIVVDNVELLLDYTAMGPRFSNTCLVAFKALLEKEPPKDRRLIVFATTTERSALQQLNLRFNEEIPVPSVKDVTQLANVLRQSGSFRDDDIERVAGYIENETKSRHIGVGIKDVLLGIEAATSSKDNVAGTFALALKDKIMENGM